MEIELMRLPLPRGPVTAMLVDELSRPPQDLPAGPDATFTSPGAPAPAEVALTDEDLQLALHVCYELHYQGFDEVDDRWEWHPSLLALRRAALRWRPSCGVGRRTTSSANSSRTARSTTSRRPIRTPGPSPGCAARRRRRWWRSRRTSTAAGGLNGCTPSCSGRPCAGWVSTTATAPTSTSCPPSPSRSPTSCRCSGCIGTIAPR